MNLRRFYKDQDFKPILEASRKAMLNMLDLALREEVDFVVISGDLYDRDLKDFSTAIWLNQSVLQVLAKHNIAVFFISGNHDADERMKKPLRVSLPSNTFFFSAKSAQTHLLEKILVAVHGQSYEAFDIKENLAKNYPAAKKDYFNIGLLHTALEGREGHAKYAPCSLADLQAKGYDYWALGHVHKREIVSTNPWVIFPGNLQGRHAKETGSKGCELVEVDDLHQVKHKHVPLAAVEWCHLEMELSAIFSLDQLLNQLNQQLDQISSANEIPLILRLSFTGASVLQKLWLDDPELIQREILGCLTYRDTDTFLEKISFSQTPTAFTDAVIKNLLLEDQIQEFKNALLTDEDYFTTVTRDLQILLNKIPADLKADVINLDFSQNSQRQQFLDKVLEQLAQYHS